MTNRTAPAILALALALVGCAPAPTTPTPDAAADACATVTGVEACVLAADAVCTRLLEYCGVSPRPAACTMTWSTLRECRADLARQGADLDCATQPTTPVCRAPIEACAGMARVVACADLLNGTARINCR